MTISVVQKITVH